MSYLEKSVFLLVLSIISISSLCSEAFWWEDISAPSITSKKAFLELLSSHDYVLIDFYMKGCHHCQLFHEEFNQVIQWLDKERKDIVVAKIDGEVNRGLAELAKVESFPAFVLFLKNGASFPIRYKYEREKQEMINFLKVFPKGKDASSGMDSKIKKIEKMKKKIQTLQANLEKSAIKTEVSSAKSSSNSSPPTKTTTIPLSSLNSLLSAESSFLQTQLTSWLSQIRKGGSRKRGQREHNSKENRKESKQLKSENSKNSRKKGWILYGVVGVLAGGVGMMVLQKCYHREEAIIKSID